MVINGCTDICVVVLTFIHSDQVQFHMQMPMQAEARFLGWTGRPHNLPLPVHIFVFQARGGTPYNGLYGEAAPKRGTLFRLEVYKRVGISRVEA